MTVEEQDFYNYISGIKSAIINEKMKQEAKNEAEDYDYFYGNHLQVEILLSKFKELNTKNPEIIAIMDYITQDYKMYKLKTTSLKEAAEFQEYLNTFYTIEAETQPKSK